MPADIAVPAGPVLVPLAVWQARREELLAREAQRRGGRVAGRGRGRRRTADDLGLLQVVGLHFPSSPTAAATPPPPAAHPLRLPGRTARDRPGLRDQFNYMTRCGFDALQPQAERYTDEQLEAAVASIDDFTQPYQRSVRTRCRCSAAERAHRPRGAQMNAAVSLLRPAPTNAATRPQLTDALRATVAQVRRRAALLREAVAEFGA